MSASPSSRLAATEAQIQGSLLRWWRMAHKGLGVPDDRLLYAIPNGAYFGGGVKQLRGGRTIALAAIRAVRMKEQGMVSGVPDLFLSTCRVHDGVFYGGLYLEMKRPKGAVRPGQREMWALLLAEGYAVTLAYSLDEAVNHITGYLRGEKAQRQNNGIDRKTTTATTQPTAVRTPPPNE